MAETVSQSIPIQIKLVSPFLGNLRQRDGTRALNTYEKDKLKYFLPDIIQWRWALNQAFESTGLIEDSVLDFIRLPQRIVAPQIYLYSRVRDKKNPNNREMFESFRTGTVISFPVFILSTLETTTALQDNYPESHRPPTKEELIQCFSLVGDQIGLSPWGSNYGYGRFDVLTADK